MPVILDTNIIIDCLKKDERTINQIEQIAKFDTLVISHVTITEIYAGVRPNEIKAVENYLNIFLRIPIQEKISKKAGQIINDLRQRGITINYQDSVIAACAIIDQVPLLTKNKKDFHNIAELMLY